MKTIEEKLAIYKAYLEGKEIEVKSHGEGEEWGPPAYMPSFNYSQYDYRIKPEPEREAVEQAYRDGREIEYCYLDDNGIWYRTVVPSFNWNICDYRVYRPVAYAYSDEIGNLTWRLYISWDRGYVRRPEFDIVANP